MGTKGKGIRLVTKKRLYGAAEIMQRINEASSDEEIQRIQKQALSKCIDSQYKKMNRSEICELERLYEEDQLLNSQE